MHLACVWVRRSPFLNRDKSPSRAAGLIIAIPGVDRVTKEFPVLPGYRRWVDAALLAELAWPAAAMPLAYVCGPTSFVEAVSQVLVQSGYR
jgi:hypothetical protein